MNTDKRHLLIESAIALFALVLWRTTLHLLGASSPMPAGFKAEAGSFIVLLGCFALARPLVSMTALLFRGKSAPPAAPVPPTEASASHTPRSALFRPSASRSRHAR